MDIWMTICMRTARCHFCEKPIKLHDPIVKGKYWKVYKGDGSSEIKKWVFPMYWHPQCWVEEGLVAVSKMKINSKGRGRKSLPIPYNDKVERNKILRRHATYVQRIRAAMDKGNIDRILRLYASMEKLNIEIEKYGGVPESWLPNNSSHQSIKPTLPVVKLPQQESISGVRQSPNPQSGSADIVVDLEHSQLHMEQQEDSLKSVS